MEIKTGSWPVMLTAFTPEGEIDMAGVDRLTDWYVESGSAGLFAVCLTSGMFDLTPDERIALAERVVRRVDGRVPVVASGTFDTDVAQQAAFVRRMADTGVAAVVCLVNYMATEDEPDTTWQARTEQLLEQTDNIPLGLYECPAPYHRQVTPELLAWAAGTGRFVFMKETSAQSAVLHDKLAAIQGTPLRVFNACAINLLPSLRDGAAGFCGLCANFFPALPAWLCAHFQDDPTTAEELQAFLSVSGGIVSMKHPAGAKHLLRLSGLDITPLGRNRNIEFVEREESMLLALRRMAVDWHDRLGLPWLLQR